MCLQTAPDCKHQTCHGCWRVQILVQIFFFVKYYYFRFTRQLRQGKYYLKSIYPKRLRWGSCWGTATPSPCPFSWLSPTTCHWACRKGRGTSSKLPQCFETRIAHRSLFHFNHLFTLLTRNCKTNYLDIWWLEPAGGILAAQQPGAHCQLPANLGCLQINNHQYSTAQYSTVQPGWYTAHPTLQPPPPRCVLSQPHRDQ